MYYYTGHIPIRAGEIKYLSSNLKNPIYYGLPKLVYDETMRYTEYSEQKAKRLMNIYSESNQ